MRRQAILVGTVVLVAAEAWAQGWRFAPSFSVGQIYDDNLFSSPEERESDQITRVSPGLGLGYRSPRLVLEGRYGRVAEWFQGHPELTSLRAGQEAALDFDGAPTADIRLKLRQTFTDTRTPTALFSVAGLDLGRARARRLLSDDSLAWAFGSVSELRLGYIFIWDEIVGGVQGRTHDASIGLDQRVAPRDTLKLTLSVRQFVFEGEDSTSAYVAMLGWKRDISSRTRFELLAGPSMSDGVWKPEIDLSLRHRLPSGEIALKAQQTQTRIIGLHGIAVVQNASLGVSKDVLRWLRLGVSPAAFRTKLNGQQATVYRVGFDAACRLAAWLTLEGSHDFSLQRGDLSGRPGHVLHNIVTVRIVAAVPQPRSASPEDEKLRLPRKPIDTAPADAAEPEGAK